MQWLECTIETASGGIELLTAYLEQCGYDSLTVEDETEFSDFLDETRPNWDYVDDALRSAMAGKSQIRLYVDQAKSESELRRLRSSLDAVRSQFPNTDFGTLHVSTKVCQDEDWENNWKEYYQPIPIGEKLIVLPEWLKETETGGRIPVVLDPGLIFGTGQHASTQMCMRALETIIRGGETVADLGSGSGILAITSLLLGAANAVAIDIDPKAEDVARSNAACNGLDGQRLNAKTGNVLADAAIRNELAAAPADIVIANIVADVIIALAPNVKQFLKENGTFLCSGIIDTREAEVAAALEQSGLFITQRFAQDGWRCFVCERRM